MQVQKKKGEKERERDRKVLPPPGLTGQGRVREERDQKWNRRRPDASGRVAEHAEAKGMARAQ